MNLGNRLRNIGLAAGLTALALTSTGCASWWNDVKAKGGIVGSYEGDYIALKQSGGVITDVYKLKDVYAESIEGSDGWRFEDQHGNIVFLGGDVKLTRMTGDNEDMWDRYCEYHQEFQPRTYHQTCPEASR